MGWKLLCNRTTGWKPRFLGYHRQTRGEGVGGGGCGPRGRAGSQHQVSPESCPRGPGPCELWAPACSGGPLLPNISPNLFCSKMSGPHCSNCTGAFIKEPSCPRLPESDRSPRCPLKGPFSGLSLTCVLAPDTSHHQSALAVPTGLPSTEPLGHSQTGGRGHTPQPLP